MALLLPTSKTPTTIVQTNRIKESIKLHNETFSFSKNLENKGKVPEQFRGNEMLSHLIEILSRPSQLYFVAKQEKGYERGQVFQYKWNLGLTANAHHVSPTSA